MSFRIHVEWRDPPDQGMAFGPEIPTWGEIRISIGEVPITRNVPRRRGGEESSDCVQGGMSGLAEWFVDRWLYIFLDQKTPFSKVVAPKVGERIPVPGLREAMQGWASMDVAGDPRRMSAWQTRHTLGHATSDIALPSIVFIPEDRQVGVAVDYPPTNLDPSVFFEIGFDGSLSRGEPVWIPKDDLVEVLERFVGGTIERASRAPEGAGWAQWLKEKFDEARRAAADTAVRRRFALGELVSKKWDEIERRLGPRAAALEQVLVDSEQVTSEAQLSSLEKHLGLDPIGGDGSELRSFRLPSGLMRLPAYLQGYTVATALRRHMGVEVDPLPELGAVMDGLGVGLDSIRSESLFRSAAVMDENGRAGIYYASDAVPFVAVAPTRFAIAAALGRLVMDGRQRRGGAFGAAQSSQARWLAAQRANAFAAEFLMPSKVFESCTDVGELSEGYGISRTAAEWHIHNHTRRV